MTSSGAMALEPITLPLHTHHFGRDETFLASSSLKYDGYFEQGSQGSQGSLKQLCPLLPQTAVYTRPIPRPSNDLFSRTDSVDANFCLFRSVYSESAPKDHASGVL